MRRIALISLCVVTSMVAAPVALASDDSVRQVVREQAARQITQDAKFKSAVKKINSRAAAKKARTATILQQRSVDTFRNAVRAEQADTEQVKAGRNQLLKGLALYNHGLDVYLNEDEFAHLVEVLSGLEQFYTKKEFHH